jgi:hypothetical protein
MDENDFQQPTHPKPMPIIVGAPRSGTTLLRLMLDSHPELAIPPETGFLTRCAEFVNQDAITRAEFYDALTRHPPQMPTWSDFGIPAEDFWAALQKIEPFTVTEGYRTFYRLYIARFNKPRWGDKSPRNIFYLPQIEKILPEARFIHIIRDGRDVALSLRPLWFSPGSDIETLASHWSKWVSSGRQKGRECQYYMEVFYEDLILNTQDVLKQICAFVDLEYDAGMERYYERTPARLKEHTTRYRSDGSVLVTHEERLIQQHLTTQPPDSSRVFAWKQAMNQDEKLRYATIAGPLLQELGYEVR